MKTWDELKNMSHAKLLLHAWDSQQTPNLIAELKERLGGKEFAIIAMEGQDAFFSGKPIEIVNAGLTICQSVCDNMGIKFETILTEALTRVMNQPEKENESRTS